MLQDQFLSHWRKDIPASFVVFLVALPLCLGIALASGAPLMAGVIAGAVGGIVVGLASGSSLGVSGPAAGLTAIVLTGIAELGSFELFLTATVLSGILQIVLGLLRAGIIAYYFPNTVIKGMLSGIGIIIVLKQIPHSVGYDQDFLGDQDFIQPDHHNTLSELMYMLDGVNLGAVLVTLAGLAIMLLWQTRRVQASNMLGMIPGPLLAVVSGIILTQLFHGHGVLEVNAGHYVELPDINGVSDLSAPALSGLSDPRVWKLALVIAIVASLETLLCSEATDKLDPWKRVTPTNKELRAQGIGNIVSGLLGGLPVTQVIVRSSANIQAGGRTKLSAILHGGLIVISVLLLPEVLRMIPLASLAAILLLVGYKLIKPALFMHYWRAGAMQFLPFFITVVGVAFTDLLTGVGLGLAVAFMDILWKNYKVPFHYDPKNYKPGMPIHIELSEDVTFLNKAAIKRTLSQLPDNTTVVLDASRNVALHPDVAEIITEFCEFSSERGITCELIGFNNNRTIANVDKGMNTLEDHSKDGTVKTGTRELESEGTVNERE